MTASSVQIGERTEVAKSEYPRMGVPKAAWTGDGRYHVRKIYTLPCGKKRRYSAFQHSDPDACIRAIPTLLPLHIENGWSVVSYETGGKLALLSHPERGSLIIEVQKQDDPDPEILEYALRMRMAQVKKQRWQVNWPIEGGNR